MISAPSTSIWIMFDRVLETESLLASNHHCAMFLAGNLAVPASFVEQLDLLFCRESLASFSLLK